MARLSASGWQSTRRARGAQQWQSQGGGFAQAGFNYEGGGSRVDSGSRYDSSSKREPDASPMHSETSSRRDSNRCDDRQKYENGPQQEGSNHHVSAKHYASKKFEATRELGDNAFGEQAIPASLVDAFDKKITSVQQEVSSSLQEATSRDNQKFDLIFGILTELQRRQVQLEESVRSLKTQRQRTSPPVAVHMRAPVQQQQQGPIPNGSSSSPSCSSPAPPQGASSMGQPPVCFPARQVPLVQQCGSMVGPDGSMQMALVTDSPTRSQMPPDGAPQSATQMMCSGPMPAVQQQQMPMHFVPPGQGGFGEEFQMGVGALADQASAAVEGSGGQPQEGAQQASTADDGQATEVSAQVEGK